MLAYTFRGEIPRAVELCPARGVFFGSCPNYNRQLMEATLQALVALLIKAIPTIALFSFLIIYLQATYFGPLAKVLKARRDKTEGVKELAQQAFESADKKTSEFERALQLARAEISKHNEDLRRHWLDEQEAAVAKARAEAGQKVLVARTAIGDEVERAKSEMDMNVESLSTSIVETITGRRAA
jgi:F0F1-type ATP synthase membrane subunit b/b'